MGEIRKTVKIPSCQIDKDTLQELCNLLDSEIQEMKKIDDKQSIHYKLEFHTKDKQIIEESSESFLSIKIPKNLIRIEIELYAFGKISRDINIMIDFFGVWGDSKIKVKGKDDTWVNGVSSKLLDVFEEEKTHNHIFKDSKTLIPISIVLSLVTSLTIQITAFSLSSSDESFSTDWETTGIIAFAMTFGWYYLLSWLFPRIEFEDFARPTRVRKKIISTLGVIIGGLVVNGIYELFK